MKIIQLSNLPIEEIYSQIKQGILIDRHNALYGYDFLISQGIEVIPITSYKRTILSKIVNRSGFLIWGQHADYYLQILAIKAAQKNKVNAVYCHYLNFTPLISFLRRIHLFNYPLIVISHDAFSQKITTVTTWKGIDRVLTLGERTLELSKEKENLSQINCDFIDWGADLDLIDNYYFSQTEQPKLDSIIATGVANRDYNTIISAMNGIENMKLNILSSYCPFDVIQPNNVVVDKNMSRSATMKLLPHYYNALAVAIPLKEKMDYCTGATILMEAMAMHKPVIITASKANLIDVKKEKIGLEVDYGDVNGWREAILYLMEHPDEAKEMGERAYHLAKTRYNYNNYCKQLFMEIQKYK